jgi:hypothetical protein
MTLKQLKELFDEALDQPKATPILAQYRVTGRDDLDAFLLLHKLVPGHNEIVSHAEHDEIWLSVDLADLAKVISEDQVRILALLGVRLDSQFEALAMFV